MSTDLKKGKFIVFEAIDGSGTSTQARLLHDYLFKKGYRVFLTEEPTSGPIGNLIRLALKKRVRMTGDKKLDDRQLAFLFAADRHDHLYNEVDGVMPKVEEGWIVICTRYVLSSIVYNSTEEAEHKFVRSLNSEFPMPDLTLFIDCPLDVCLSRLNQGRPVKDIYENREKLKQTRVSYDQLLVEYPGEVQMVNGQLEMMEQHKEIVKMVEGLLME